MSYLRFQSHNGAIAGVSYFAGGTSKERFQSHNGAIAAQGKILGFGGRMRRNERRVAVDLRLPEEPKGVDGK